MKRQVKQPNTIFTVLRNNAQGKYNMQVQDRKELTIVSDDDLKSCGIDLLNDRSIAIEPAEAASIEQLFVILSILLSSFAIILLCYIPNGLLLHIRVLIVIR